MPEPPSHPLALATAGQLRRAGFVIKPDTTANDETDASKFEILTNHADPASAAEHEAARKRGQGMPKR